jgi:hypothetical protein
MESLAKTYTLTTGVGYNQKAPKIHKKQNTEVCRSPIKNKNKKVSTFDVEDNSSLDRA